MGLCHLGSNGAALLRCGYHKRVAKAFGPALGWGWVQFKRHEPARSWRWYEWGGGVALHQLCRGLQLGNERFVAGDSAARDKSVQCGHEFRDTAAAQWAGRHRL